MSVWTDRDAVVLRWLHESPPSAETLHTTLSTEPHPDLLGLSQQDAHLAVETLADEDLLHYNDERWASGPSALWTGLHVSGAGLQALGEWPTFDALSSPAELGQVLDALAEQLASTDEEESKPRCSSAARFGSAARCVAADRPSGASERSNGWGAAGRRPQTDVAESAGDRKAARRRLPHLSRLRGRGDSAPPRRLRVGGPRPSR
jgi:hypothetical protein